MRSSRNRLAVVLVLAAISCDGPTVATNPTPDECVDSFLTYENFGEPFMLDWCRGCHSAGLPADMRQNAPAEINFDTLDQVRQHAVRIEVRAAGIVMPATMPPAAGPDVEERALLDEWLACGAL